MDLSRRKLGKIMKKYEETGVFLVRNKQTKDPLYFVWKFNDETSQRITYDPQDEWCIFLEQSLREEHAQDVRHSRHKTNFFRGINLDIEDIPEETEEYNAEEDLIGEEEIAAFLATLTETQLRRYKLKEQNPDYTLTKIAELEKVDVTSVRECFLSIQKKLKKFLSKNTPKIR